jgi:hypothetical protein
VPVWTAGQSSERGRRSGAAKDSSSTAKLATLPAIASGDLGNFGIMVWDREAPASLNRHETAIFLEDPS